MFPSSKAVKSTALENLRGNWAKAAGAALIPVAATAMLACVFDMLLWLTDTSAVAYAAGVPAVLCAVFIISPLMLGTVRFFRAFALDKNTDIACVFEYFSSKTQYFRAVRFTFSLFIRVFIIGFFFMLPSILTDLAYRGNLDFLMRDATPLWFGDLWIVTLVLRIIAAALLAIVVLKYYLAPFIFAANDNITAAEAIHQSTCAAKISAGAFASLLLSMLGWILISVTLIPLVFTLPYFLACYNAHGNFAVFHYNKSLRVKKENEFFNSEFEI